MKGPAVEPSATTFVGSCARTTVVKVAPARTGPVCAPTLGVAPSACRSVKAVPTGNVEPVNERSYVSVPLPALCT